MLLPIKLIVAFFNERDLAISTRTNKLWKDVIGLHHKLAGFMTKARLQNIAHITSAAINTYEPDILDTLIRSAPKLSELRVTYHAPVTSLAVLAEAKSLIKLHLIFTPDTIDLQLPDLSVTHLTLEGDEKMSVALGADPALTSLKVKSVNITSEYRYNKLFEVELYKFPKRFKWSPSIQHIIVHGLMNFGDLLRLYTSLSNLQPSNGNRKMRALDEITLHQVDLSDAPYANQVEYYGLDREVKSFGYNHIFNDFIKHAEMLFLAIVNMDMQHELSELIAHYNIELLVTPIALVVMSD